MGEVRGVGPDGPADIPTCYTGYSYEIQKRAKTTNNVAVAIAATATTADSQRLTGCPCSNGIFNDMPVTANATH